MRVQIEKVYFETYIQPNTPEDHDIAKQAKENLRYGSTKFDIDVSKWSLEQLEGLYELAKMTDNRSIMVQLSPMIKVLNDENSKVTNLNALSKGLIEIMKKYAIDGWIYEIAKDGFLNPYLVTQIRVVEPYGKDDRPYVQVSLVSNNTRYAGDGTVHKKTLTYQKEDLQGKSVHEILADDNFYIETPELKKIHNEYLELFEQYQPQFNKQFWFEGVTYSDYDYGYSSREVISGKSRIVNDEEIISRKYRRLMDSEFWQMKGVEEGFNIVPFHTYIRAFNLTVHKEIWAHVTQITPYIYDKSLRDKLILPQDHRDLIDILVEDMDILQDDIIKGKSGGTTILCTGKPGLGKTLSAEAYSEIVERPLYRIHSGQLGLTSDKVEKNLETILKRAERWNAVLLIDEADVYIRARGNDLEHNSVVAAFLRTLEYFSGLLFMTTNRGDDVDDAILSRCIATIKYETPTPENARQIWAVLSTQFNVDLSWGLITDLVKKYPNLSGRDIKELLKLASRFAKGKNIQLDMEVFRQCSQFRGIS